MGIPLKQGRAFTKRDSGNAPKVAMIDETLAGPGPSTYAKPSYKAITAA